MNNITQLRTKAPMTDDRDPNARIDTHEAVCAERYAGINAQLRRLEKWFITLITAVIGFGAAIILKEGI